MWLTIIKIIISKIPREYFIKSIIRFYEGFKNNPILTFIILFVIWQLQPLLFVHKNTAFIKESQDLKIEREINTALNDCGNGTTIARIGIGTEFITDDRVSFLFDIIRSCDKSLVPFRKDGKCDLDVKWLNPAWQETEEIDLRTLEALNRDTIDLGSFSLSFRDNVPLWLNMFNKEGGTTKIGAAIEEMTPKLFKILSNSKRTIKDIGIVKIRHPIYRHIVYLYTMSFWYNDDGLPDMKCEKNKTRILRKLAKMTKQSLS